MTTNERPTPDEIGTWEPDWKALEALTIPVGPHRLWAHPELIREIIADYHRQQAAHGMVEVRREVLHELVNRYSGLRDRYYREARETLAAATGQDR
jgi:hypothetical protein